MPQETLSCFYRRCDASFTGPRKRGRNEASDACDEEAGKLGWVIGHLDGQAHYACPDHAGCLWDPIVLKAIGRKKSAA